MRPRASSTRLRLLLTAHAGAIAPGARVLDIGCGNGSISQAIADTFACEVHGADIRNLLTAPIPFSPIVEGRIACPDQAFDVALLTDVLHHIDPADQPAAIREAVRVARTVLIFEQHPTLTAKVLDVVMAFVVYAGREPLPLSHRDPDAWVRLIAAATGRSGQLTRIPHPWWYPLHHFAVRIEEVAPAGFPNRRDGRVKCAEALDK